jgi:hypothetical protein
MKEAFGEALLKIAWNLFSLFVAVSHPIILDDWK